MAEEKKEDKKVETSKPAGKKTSEKKVELEREYVIPLRAKYQHVARYKKTPKAVKIIKEFLVRHMKVYDRDLNKIKIDKYLNEFLWFRGIKNPPHKIKVRAVKDGEIVRVELAEMPDKLKFKKLREEKREAKAREIVESKKTMMQKAREAIKSPQSSEKSQMKESLQKKPGQTEEEKAEEKEKAKAGAEAGKKMEKIAAKKMKHSAGGKTKQPKRQQRKALAK